MNFEDLSKVYQAIRIDKVLFRLMSGGGGLFGANLQLMRLEKSRARRFDFTEYQLNDIYLSLCDAS